MIELAIYDMDRTITRTGTFTPFMLHAAGRLAPWRLIFAPAAAAVALGYVAKLIERKTVKETNQRLMVGHRVTPARFREAAETFADRTLRFNVHPGALDAIATDRAAGRRLVMATASSRLYVESIAARLGFDDVIATNGIQGLDEYVSPKIDGENCYGPAKLRMIKAWMAAEGLERTDCHIRFYSDHASDVPVFEWADVPLPVNAHAKLRRIAKERGWPLQNWGI
jgi:HAD superfamily hydrolase (TIGR01490 family)